MTGAAADRSPVNPDFPGLMPGLLQDPYPTFARLRSGPPVFWAPLERAWVLHRQTEIETVLSDRGMKVADLAAGMAEIGQRSGKPLPMLTGFLQTLLPFVNPPDHDLLRRYYRAVLSPDAMHGAAEAISVLALDLLAEAAPDGRFDAVTGYAEMLPALVIAWFLGLPGPMVRGYAKATVELDRIADRGPSPRFLARMEAVIAKHRQPIQNEVAARRAAGLAGKTDGLSRMIALADEMRSISDHAIADQAMALIFAATENTSALIGNTIAAVVEAGLHGNLATADDATCLAAAREALRLEAPVQQISRFADRNFQLGGAQIVAGDRLVLLVGAAQRDPAFYPDPDRFDLTRFGTGAPASRNLSLGRGVHYCLGADLGLLETAVALRMIARRKPRRDPDRPFVYEDGQTLRRLRHLPLILHPEGA